MGIGLRLKTILHNRKMTIKQLAEESGVSINTLYSITKRDSENIDSVILRKLSTALNVSEEELSGQLVVTFSTVGFTNDDNFEELYTFDSDSYLGRVAITSHGLGKDGREQWLSVGRKMVGLDNNDRQRIVDYAILLSNQPKQQTPQSGNSEEK